MKILSGSRLARVVESTLVAFGFFVASVGHSPGAEQAPAVSTTPPKRFTERPPPPDEKKAPVGPQAAIVTAIPPAERRPAPWSSEVERLEKECEAEEFSLLQERVEFLARVASATSAASDADFAAFQELQRARVEQLAKKRRQIEEAMAAHRRAAVTPSAPVTTSLDRPGAAPVAVPPMR